MPARAVVSQFYVTEAENEYVIRANSAIMKCKIPSFVSEFVQVDQWVANDGTIYMVGDDYGRRRRCDLVTVLTYEPGRRASVSPPRSNFNVSFPFPERTNSDGTKGKRDTTRIQSRCYFSTLFYGFRVSGSRSLG